MLELLGQVAGVRGPVQALAGRLHPPRPGWELSFCCWSSAGPPGAASSTG